MRIELPNRRMKTRKRYELMFGAISVAMIFEPRRPDRRARLTNSRDVSENV